MKTVVMNQCIGHLMNQDEWEEKIIKYMTESGWVLQEDKQDSLNFGFVEGEKHWMRDYDKKTHRFIQFDGNQKINLV